MKNLITVFAISILLSACSSTKVLSDIDKEVNFDNYKTYAWSATVDPINKDFPQYDNSLNRKRWKNAIDAAMQKEGFVLREGNVDLEMDFHIQLERNAVVDRSYHNDEINHYAQIEPNALYQYDEGTMTIHLLDLEQKQVVWQGVTTRILDIGLIENADVTIQKAVSKLFEKFHSQRTVKSKNK
ncbi:DUF4136 domain-containing protein [Maribacter sp. ACAM166]|uniref:DUF4136 domain-containing protein n=1 Tax=Maribacter sp. ACAM166 TaxID=2508996 RepID=UPI0014859E8C|nr:DUF4136 domain-containing protein [Maribacter sp. ACAM166]